MNTQQTLSESIKNQNKENEIKKKIITEKEIIDFLIFVEDKFELNNKKLNEFKDIFNNFENNDGRDCPFEEILLNSQEFLIKYPFLVMEFNKLLPKNYKLAILNTNFTKSFLLKLRRRDENSFSQVMKLLEKHKLNELDFESLLKELEEILIIYPDLYDEMLIIMDVKKYSKTRGVKDGRKNFHAYPNLHFRKHYISASFTNPNVILNGSEYENSNIKDKDLNQQNYKIGNKEVESNQKHISFKEPETITKGSSWKDNTQQGDPEYLFFESLKNMISPIKYMTFIKLLFLYNKGILSHFEFCKLIDSSMEEYPELSGIIKQLAMSKLISRKHSSIMMKPLTEVDTSKFKKISTSYFDFTGEHYCNTQCSAQEKLGLAELFNNSYISIPNGSEDDKNPLKKNHYEENIFKYEDQRYEMDMQIDGLKYCLEELSQKGLKTISNISILVLKKVYKEFFQQIYDSFITNPVQTSEVMIERLKKRIQESTAQKTDLDKTIRASFDRFYSKSFDYRSFKFKNNEKKYTNPKAFVKEISKKSLDKLNTNNINILKGGTENNEFYSSFPTKFSTNQASSLTETNSISSADMSFLTQKIIDNYNNSNNDHEDVNIFKRYLPDIRLSLNNKLALKTSVYIIFIYIEKFFEIEDRLIIKNYLIFIFEQFLSIKISNIQEDQEENKATENENLIELFHLESMKNHKPSSELNSIMDKLMNDIENKSSFDPNDLVNSTFMKTIRKSTSVKSDQEDSLGMTLTPSLESNDNGKQLKKTIVNDSPQYLNIFDYCNKESIKSKFLPKENYIENNLFYCSEQIYVIIRYIFCIYERISKLNDSCSFITKNLLNKNNISLLEKNVIEKEKIDEAISNENKNQNEAKIKQFVVVFNAFLNKKLDNTNQFEEVCRDILGNESYFLLNFDKLMLSFAKSVLTLPNENRIDEMIDLYFREKTRKNKPNEEAYLTNYLSLSTQSYYKHFRLLFNKENMILTMHYFESDDKYKNKEDIVSKVLETDYDDYFNSSIDKTKNRSDAQFQVDNKLCFYLDESNFKVNFIELGYQSYYYNSIKLIKQKEDFIEKQINDGVSLLLNKKRVKE